MLPLPLHFWHHKIGLLNEKYSEPTPYSFANARLTLVNRPDCVPNVDLGLDAILGFLK